MTGGQTEEREVHWLLAVGILFFPLIFVWFLARKGYSTLARGIGGAWTALCLMFLMVIPGDERPNRAYADASSAPSAEAIPSQPVGQMQYPVASQEATPQSSYQAAPQPSRDFPVRATSAQIAQAYENNEVSAKMQYGGKTLLVTGIVTGITLDIMDNPVIQMEGVNQFLPVQAAFDKSYSGRLSQISKGQQITVTCREITEVISAPLLDECSL